MFNHDEFLNFFEVLITLREEYIKSNDSSHEGEIAALAQVATEVIRYGKIPDYLRVERPALYNPAMLINSVKELFKRLSIHIEICDQGKCSKSGVSMCYVTFSTK